MSGGVLQFQEGLDLGGGVQAVARYTPNAMEPIVIRRLSTATGQPAVLRPAQQGGADFLPLQLNLRILGFTF